MGEDRIVGTALVIGLVIGAVVSAAVTSWIVSAQLEDCTPYDRPAPDGCYPCHDAMEHHSTQWANGEGNESWHLERRDHWKKANQLGADCSDWKRVDGVGESS